MDILEVRREQSEKTASFFIYIKITKYIKNFQKTTKNYLLHGFETVL